VVVELAERVVAEPVEASKHPLWEKSYGGGFDRLNHHDRLSNQVANS